MYYYEPSHSKSISQYHQEVTMFKEFAMKDIRSFTEDELILWQLYVSSQYFGEPHETGEEMPEI